MSRYPINLKGTNIAGSNSCWKVRALHWHRFTSSCSATLLAALMGVAVGKAFGDQAGCGGSSRYWLGSTAKAELIVVGTITSRRSYVNGDSSISTEFRVAVEEVLKGKEPGSTVCIVTPGGKVEAPDGKFIFENLTGFTFPSYQVDDRVLVYLVATESPGGCHSVMVQYFRLVNGMVADGQTVAPATKVGAITEDSLKSLVEDMVACCDYNSIAEAADTIVMGTVESVEDKISEERRMMAVHVLAESAFKGQISDQRILVLLSRLEDARVSEGSKVIFFLRKGADGYETVIPIAGQFTVSSDGTMAKRAGLEVSVEELLSAARAGR